jgi:hypothetical protein
VSPVLKPMETQEGGGLSSAAGTHEKKEEEWVFC